MRLFNERINNETYWSLYTEHGEYQEEISSYLIHCVDDMELDDVTVRGRAYALRNWAIFSTSSHKSILNADDTLIKKYRDHLLEHGNKNSSGDMKSRKRSINQYLRIIYDFYRFAQQSEFAPFLLGPSDIFNITSQLMVDTKKTSEYEKYPLLFKRTSSKSKHRTTYTPDYATFLSLYRYFISHHSAEVAERDCLILKIAFEAGFRVGSTASLKVSDFDIDKVLASDSIFSVQPAVQKFGRNNSFDVSINLAMSIVDYIQGPRKELVDRLRSKSDYLFLDTMKGSNLLSTTISSNFSKASKALGLPYRSGIHCWRGLFTENLIEYELDTRKELGFDTSIESVGLVVAKALGHSSPLSQQNYIRSLVGRDSSSQAFKHRQEIATLRDQLLHAIKTTELLRREIFELVK